MPRHAVPSTRLVARVRVWFGLHQAELAVYLGVSPTLVQALETGQRGLTADVLRGLLPLMAHLPAAPPAGALPPADPPPPSLAPGTPAPDAAALDFRRRVCLYQAARHRAQADKLAQQARVAHRWAHALPALLAAVPPAGTDPAAADRAAWLADWLGRRARPLPAAAATRWHLLHARAAALDAEAAALAASA